MAYRSVITKYTVAVPHEKSSPVAAKALMFEKNEAAISESDATAQCRLIMVVFKNEMYEKSQAKLQPTAGMCNTDF